MAPRLRATVVAAAGVVTALAAVASASVLGGRGVAAVSVPRRIRPMTDTYRSVLREPMGDEATAVGEPLASLRCLLPVAACAAASATIADALASDNKCFAHSAAARATLHAAAATLDAYTAAGCCEASPELLESLKAVVALDQCLPASLTMPASWIMADNGDGGGHGGDGSEGGETNVLNPATIILEPGEAYDTCCAGFAHYLTACCSNECFHVAMIFGGLFPLEACCGPLIDGYADPDHPEQAPLAPASACA